MGRVKKCVHCEEVLVCAACGQRQTPVKSNKRKITTITLDKNAQDALDAKAAELGISRSELVNRLATGEVTIDGEAEED